MDCHGRSVYLPIKLAMGQRLGPKATFFAPRFMVENQIPILLQVVTMFAARRYLA